MPTHIVAQNLARCVRDPGFVVPPAAVRRLNDMLESVDPSKMWCGVSTTEQEHRFETLELALASGDPAGITRTVRAIARDLRVRRGLPLRQAGYELSEYRLALSASEVEAVREVWDSLRALGSAADQETERAEYLLFELLVPRLSAVKNPPPVGAPSRCSAADALPPPIQAPAMVRRGSTIAANHERR